MGHACRPPLTVGTNLSELRSSVPRIRRKRYKTNVHDRLDCDPICSAVNFLASEIEGVLMPLTIPSATEGPKTYPA